MTSQLMLMRHAKSDHGDPSLSDHDRPLGPRGRRDTPRMAVWLQRQGCIPDLILCSSSCRTHQTADLLLDQWDEKPIVQSCESLYLSSPETMLATLRSENGGFDRVMVLAHNPGTSMLASMMANQSLDMATAAVAIFDISNPEGQTTGQSSPEPAVSNPIALLNNRCGYTLTHHASPKTIEL